MKRSVQLNNAAVVITGLALAIILIWIGAFKFTPTEAKGIEGLVQNSPLMSWLYKIFSLQTTSNLIGSVEIITGVAIVAGFFYPKAGVVGGALSAIIFFTTSTFLFSTPGAFAQVDGLWVPSGLGSFLIKDLVALGASLLFLADKLGKLND